MFYRSLYAIKDVKSGFSDPCVQVNDAVAVRSFQLQVPRMSNDLGIPLSDFQLWRVGQFDIDSGMLRPETPELILDGASLLPQAKSCDSCRSSDCHECGYPGYYDDWCDSCEFNTSTGPSKQCESCVHYSELIKDEKS